MNQPSHFQGKDALHHVAERQAQGILKIQESHSPELPDHLSCMASSLKDTAFLFALLALLFHFLMPHIVEWSSTFLILGLVWSLWRGMLSTLRAYNHLERLKRLTLEEKYEIEHHRQQERDELGVIYAAKGFEGELLEQVLDVLMADDNRLLKVMLEEEMGLVLDKQEHPLKMGLFSFFGALIATLFSALALYYFHLQGVLVMATAAICLSVYVIACYLKNTLSSAIVWHLGIFFVCLSVGYCLTQLSL